MSLFPSDDNARRVLLGQIVGAHGLKGEVKIASFTARVEDVAAYGPLASEDGARTFAIEAFRVAGNGAMIARLAGICDRDAAEALRGTSLYVRREVLPEVSGDEEEYYHSDLVGLTATSADGESVGHVIAVQNFGAGDLLEIRRVETRQSELIPFDKAHVPHVDIVRGQVTVIMPQYEREQTAAENGP